MSETKFESAMGLSYFSDLNNKYDTKFSKNDPALRSEFDNILGPINNKESLVNTTSEIIENTDGTLKDMLQLRTDLIDYLVSNKTSMNSVYSKSEKIL